MTDDELPNYDCLGCLMEAHNTGKLNDEEYEEVFEELAKQDAMETVPCPRCNALAYVSLYEPDLAHCPSCGLYSMLMGGQWQPFIEYVHGSPTEASADDAG